MRRDLSLPGRVVTRAELKERGIGDGRLHRLVATQKLHRVGRALYAVPGVPVELASLLARAGGGAALSHASAARAWGLPCDDTRDHITVANGSRRRWAEGRVAVHQSRRAEAVVLDEISVTPLERTLIDIATTLPFDQSVPVLDAGLRLGADARSLARWARGSRATEAIRLADARAESPLESMLRLTLTLGGLPPADLQHTVRERGRFVSRVDLWYPGVVVEADGFEFHRRRADYGSDRRKGQAYGRLGLLVQRFTWENVVGAPHYTVASVRETLACRERLQAA